MDRAQKKPALTAGGSSDAEIATPLKKKVREVQKTVAEGGRKGTYPRESRRFRPGQRGRPPHRWVWPPAHLPPSQLTQEMRQFTLKNFQVSK
jgi:hypothetical protein